MTTAQDGGKVISLMDRPPLPPGDTPGMYNIVGWRNARRIFLKAINIYHTKHSVSTKIPGQITEPQSHGCTPFTSFTR